jgi:hypothetical protein
MIASQRKHCRYECEVVGKGQGLSILSFDILLQCMSLVAVRASLLKQIAGFLSWRCAIGRAKGEKDPTHCGERELEDIVVWIFLRTAFFGHLVPQAVD